MLVAKDCGEVRHERRWVSPLLVGLIAGLAVVSTAARGLAGPQQKKGETESPIRTVSATADKTKGQKFALFSRPTAPANHASFADSGAFHLAVRDVMKIPAFKGSFEELLSTEMLTDVDVSAVDLSNLDSISSSLMVFMGKNPGSESPDRNALQFGTRGLSVATLRDVDWKTAIAQYAPNAEYVADQDQSYFAVNAPAMSVRLVPRNSRELRIFTGSAGGQRYLGFEHANRASRPTEPNWKAEWEALSGGVLTAVWRVEQPKVPVPHDDRWGKLAAQYNEQVDVFGYGIDVAPDFSELGIRIRIRCRDGVASDEVRTSVRETLDLLQTEITGADGTADPMSGFLADVVRLSQTSLTTGEVGGRGYVSCEFETPLPEFVRTLLNSPHGPTSTKPAE